MKTIKIKLTHWTELQTINGEDTNVEMSTAELLEALIQLTPPQFLPTGLNAFDIMKDMRHSLDQSKITDTLIFASNTYKWLSENAFKHIPARWGLMPDLAEAIDNIRNAEEIELEPEKT